MIADPTERNRAINAAYARLWLHDERFQWAGLAAFASKQVGCGLLHAADSIKKIHTETAAVGALMSTFSGPHPLISVETVDLLQKKFADYQVTNADNPIPFDCSGLMKPDTHLGENARHIEVSDDQTTPCFFR